MPSSSSSFSRCLTCGKEFKNSKGLARHQNNVQKYNQHQEELDEIPINTIDEFKQIIVSEIHKKLSLSFKTMGKKLVTIPCTESIFFSVFGGHIHYYFKVKEFYKCFFRGSNSYEILSEIFNSEQWGKKVYSQNQVTYIVCLDPISWNNSSQDQSVEEINPLENLLQLSIKKKIIKRRPRFLRGEILIEWKKKIFKEINGNINKAGYLYINFYISQSQNF
ncbi:hypothetical protein Glove_97g108 [Diversispora epigaea]|uniref:C2H2-type domain-containing protein n=1 Tax=Diversispora epigaea TaxID=1348612 RepID=A0A397J972_9GLOM|nr:hypothetical protein Glove_97g108 [Diversispora epigaea]